MSDSGLGYGAVHLVQGAEKKTLKIRTADDVGLLPAYSSGP